ncbi:formyltetrahydrofolate-dependent phosphoribosylglycinamide formyltransferase [Flavobacterium succinicans]|uniref:Phosphoribosylglycinamide formyltransferase n=1 Tax=Flavobacterium succinicans TaxID=29536 RepID=A0A1I4V0K7_9FLAO|nr:phosphoribosylglycinamide formyltransferase [Flavobacterium succinicans]SFM94583.1 formyltetrahydrofolate-dependent phosphoribosylglycinamide formyltransferase [Flavobacterium succinicans]
MKNIVVFASGSGTNAENIIKYFSNSPFAKVVGVFTNNPKAKVIDRAQQLQVPCHVFSKEDLNEGNILQKIQNYEPDLIVLAGFLLKVPPYLIDAYSNQIINIHPALLPKFGGKGMYGKHIHEAVVQNSEKETGITIHYVNEHYDEGAVIFQTAVALTSEDTAESVAAKIHELEQQFFPVVIADVLQ